MRSDLLVPRASDGGCHVSAQQRPVLGLEVLELVTTVGLLDQGLMGTVTAAVACPVPQLKDDAATVRPVLDVLALAVSMERSLWTIGNAHVVVAVPFLTPVMMARFEGFDKNLKESSLDLGENSWMTIWRVTFPLILPRVGASLLMSFTGSFDEFLFAFFLGGNEKTSPVFMWTQVRYLDTLPTVLALGASIFMVSVVLIGTAEWLRPMGGKQTKNISR